jgi:hypothetical protein
MVRGVTNILEEDHAICRRQQLSHGLTNRSIEKGGIFVNETMLALENGTAV